jgi:putative zinc finger protein
MTNSNMTCEAFDAALPDHLEGTLDERLRASVAKHLSECVRCASLVRDLDKIRKEAAALPDLVPSRDLWQGIEARIAAPVIPLTARPEPKRRFAPAWMGVAAAALILITAGITYTLTARSFQGGTATVAQVTPTNPAPAQSGSDIGVTEPSPTTNPSGTGGTRARAATTPSTAVASESSPRRPAPIARLVNQQVSEDVYSREIAMLQKIVTDRRTQLDSSTVAIIERNLRIIDAAIAQSRAALANDPASRLLSDQLTHALDKKVELLRTAAMLPSA